MINESDRKQLIFQSLNGTYKCPFNDVYFVNCILFSKGSNDCLSILCQSSVQSHCPCNLKENSQDTRQEKRHEVSIIFNEQKHHQNRAKIMSITRSHQNKYSGIKVSHFMRFCILSCCRNYCKIWNWQTYSRLKFILKLPYLVFCTTQ